MKLIATGIAAFLLAAQASSALRAQAPGASIEGAVTRVGTEDPIAGAQVTLVGSGVAVPPLTTDRTGTFSFQNLQAGTYTLNVVANGYARQAYGRRHVNAPSMAIVLSQAETLKNIKIGLTPAGNISGRIRDTNGRPAVGIRVRLMRLAYNSSGRRTASTAASVRTDDRGQYRIFWVTPGRYYVVAGSPTLGIDARSDNANEILENYPFTFFPGSTQLEKALAIDVQPGAEVEGVDFVVETVPLYQITARVIDPVTGKPPSQGAGSISYWTPSGSGSSGGGTYYNAQTGILNFPRLMPGQYTVSISAYQGTVTTRAMNRTSSEMSAGADVVVSNADVDVGVLKLEPPNVIEGKITGPGLRIEGPSTSTLRVSLVPNSGVLEASQRVPEARPQPDGNFTIYTAHSFPVRVSVTGLPLGFYVREARLNGSDALVTSVQVSPASQLEIVLGQNAAEINGVVRDENKQPTAGARVVLVPDRLRHHPELFKETVSDHNGKFSITSIPPGDYKVFAWEALEPYEYFDPEVLGKDEPNARPVHLVESSRETLDLRMIPAGAGR